MYKIKRTVDKFVVKLIERRRRRELFLLRGRVLDQRAGVVGPFRRLCGDVTILRSFGTV